MPCQGLVLGTLMAQVPLRRHQLHGYLPSMLGTRAAMEHLHPCIYLFTSTALQYEHEGLGKHLAVPITFISYILSGYDMAFVLCSYLV